MTVKNAWLPIIFFLVIFSRLYSFHDNPWSMGYRWITDPPGRGNRSWGRGPFYFSLTNLKFSITPPDSHFLHSGSGGIGVRATVKFGGGGGIGLTLGSALFHWHHFELFAKAPRALPAVTTTSFPNPWTLTQPPTPRTCHQINLWYGGSPVGGVARRSFSVTSFGRLTPPPQVQSPLALHLGIYFLAGSAQTSTAFICSQIRIV